MTSFVLDIQAFAEKALLGANKSVCNAFEEIGAGTVVESPDPPGVGGFSKGLLKNSWYPEVGGGIDNTVGTVANPTGADSLSRIKAVTNIFPFYGKDNVITLTNSIHYVMNAEDYGWMPEDSPPGWQWTGRVPAYGMVKTAITNYRAKHI